MPDVTAGADALRRAGRVLGAKAEQSKVEAEKSEAKQRTGFGWPSETLMGGSRHRRHPLQSPLE
jgi:hypothetical protein